MTLQTLRIPAASNPLVKSVLPVATAIGVQVVLLVSFGVTFWETIKYSLYLLLVILLPGRALWIWGMRAKNGLNEGTRQPSFALESWVCGAALGYGLELGGYVLARALGLPRMYLVVPAVVLLAWQVSVRRWRKTGEGLVDRDAPVQTLSGGVKWCLAGVVSYLALWLAFSVFATHPLRASGLTDPDEMFHLSLVGELRHHFPAVYPYMEYPGTLTYQWFVHAHMAASTWATGLPAETVYRRFDPLILSVLGVLGVGLLAARVSNKPWALPIAGALLVMVGSFDVTGAVVGEAAPEERFLQGLILMHSPTQTFAYSLVVPVAVLSVEALRRGAIPSAATWVVLTLSMTAVAGAKVTFLPLVVCGFASAACVAFFRKERLALRNASIGFALTLAVIVLTSAVLYRGDSQTLGWSPLQSTEFFMRALGISGGGVAGELVIASALLAMWLVPCVGIVALIRNPATRWDPRLWWLGGAVASGYGATMLLGHIGSSQVYFGRAAAGFGAAASTWGLVTMFERASKRTIKQAVLGANAAGLAIFLVRFATEKWRQPAPLGGEMIDSPVLRVWVNLPVLLTIVLAMWLLRVFLRDATHGRRSLGLRTVVVVFVGFGLARSYAFLAGHTTDRDPPSTRMSYGSDGRAAAEWLGHHADANESVLTNVHCGPARPTPGKCDSRHFWMSAISERRFVLEGWAYTPRSGAWVGSFWGRHQFVERNDSLFTHPTEVGFSQFLRRHPAQWAIVDVRLSPDLSGLAQVPGITPRYVNGNYTVYHLAIKHANDAQSSGGLH